MNTPPHAGSINPDTAAAVGGRIDWIDSLRGLAILLVVFGHVSRVSFEAAPGVLSALFSYVNMPLFFFLSGFVAWRAGRQWTAAFALRQLGGKALHLLVPFALFFAVKVWKLDGIPLRDALADPMKCGYWFLPVLFYMFAAWYAVCRITARAGAERFRDALLVATAFVLLAAGFLLRKGSDSPAWFSGLLFCRFFHFFVAGLLARKYEARFFRLFRPAGMTALVVLFFGMMLVLGRSVAGATVGDALQGAFGSLALFGVVVKYVPLPYAGLLLAFGFFYKYREDVGRGRPAGRMLQYVGRRTLDIYLIHYFLLPVLPFVGPFFTDYPNDLLYVAATVAVSVLVMTFSLLVGSIVRMSDPLAALLFGQRSARP